jgi:hypothetical protein
MKPWSCFQHVSSQVRGYALSSLYWRYSFPGIRNILYKNRDCDFTTNRVRSSSVLEGVDIPSRVSFGSVICVKMVELIIDSKHK